MLSRTVFSFNKLNAWKTTPTCRRRNFVASESDILTTSLPPISTDPASAAKSPAAIWRKVDLPLPDGPIKDSKPPDSISSEKSCKTICLP